MVERQKIKKLKKKVFKAPKKVSKKILKKAPKVPKMSKKAVAPKKKSGIFLFKSDGPKMKKISNYKEFIRFLLSGDVDYELAD